MRAHAPESWKVREWARQAHVQAVTGYVEPFKRSRYRDAVEQARERVDPKKGFRCGVGKGGCRSIGRERIQAEARKSLRGGPTKA